MSENSSNKNSNENKSNESSDSKSLESLKDNKEQRRLSDSSSDSELSSTKDNIKILRLKDKQYSDSIKPKKYIDNISERLRFRAFDYLNLKTYDYLYNCMNGIHKLLYDWEIKNHSKILPTTDLKQLILILIHREKEIIEDVIDIIYDNEIDIDSCGCIFQKTNDNIIQYRKIDRISIKEDVEINNDNKSIICKNKSLNFKLAYPDVYNYIQDNLHISLDYVIYIPSIH